LCRRLTLNVLKNIQKKYKIIKKYKKKEETKKKDNFNVNTDSKKAQKKFTRKEKYFRFW